MPRRCFTVKGSLEIKDEDGHVIHQEWANGDIWDDGGIYKTYLKCLKYGEGLLTPKKEHKLRALVCRICPACKRTTE